MRPLWILAPLLVIGPPAWAQGRTTGAIEGVVEARSGDRVAGAEVSARSPALQGVQEVETDGRGGFLVTQLPPGDYALTVQLSETAFTVPGVEVRVGKVTHVDLVVEERTAGEVVTVEGRPPLVDQGSTKTGVTLGEAYARHLPTGRSFGTLLEAAPGARDDRYGASFGGSTSPENVYLVEGLDVTGTQFGALGVDLPTEFVEEVEVVTGGYQAEYGRSTGGVVNVVTRSGGNELRGSVFAYLRPGALQAAAVPIGQAGGTIGREEDLAWEWDVGAELGGPLIRDRLWFHLGVNPAFERVDVHRVIRSQVDADQDGVPDLDAAGAPVLAEVGRSTLAERTTALRFTGKLTAAVTPDHRATLAFFGDPSGGRAFPDVAGERSAIEHRLREGGTNLVGRWASLLDEGRTEVEAVLGWHRHRFRSDASGASPFVAFFDGRPLPAFAPYGEEVPAACEDGAGDPYPHITNCPTPSYLTGSGLGLDSAGTRTMGVVSVTRRVRWAGEHALEAGLDLAHQQLHDRVTMTAGTRYFALPGGVWLASRFYTPGKGADAIACGPDVDGDGTGDATCVFQPDGLASRTATRHLGVYLQDTWSPVPRLTLNLGLRYDHQTIFAARHLRGETSAVSGEPIRPVALVLGDQLAPRIGALFDPTGQGRARVFGHYGRFYEAIPMGMNDRMFGGEVIGRSLFLPGQCDDTERVAPCPMDDPFQSAFLGSGTSLVAPGLKGQRLDEVLLGVEHEVVPGLEVGLVLAHRALGRVIEDVSTDGATSFLIANPGEVDEEAVDDLRAEAAQAREAGDEGRAAFLDHQADLFEGVAAFDTPQRRWDGVQLTVRKRLGDRSGLLASYVFSRLVGNYPGLFSPQSGQLDPNTTTMYDLPELMANRYGPLPGDRPHQLAIDGWYGFSVAGAGTFVLGSRFRASSGRPRNALGANVLYGPKETWILPQGSAGRTPSTTRLDVHAAWLRPLSRSRETELELFVDVFHLLNRQTPLTLDDLYTSQFVNPIVGGTAEDLAHLQAIDPATGSTSGTLVTPDASYGSPTTRQSPRSVRLGARVRF